MPLTPTVLHHWSDGKRIHAIMEFNSGTYLTNENSAGYGSQVIWPREIKSGSKPILVISGYITSIGSNISVDGITGVNARTLVLDIDPDTNLQYVRLYNAGSELSNSINISGIHQQFYAIFHQFR